MEIIAKKTTYKELAAHAEYQQDGVVHAYNEWSHMPGDKTQVVI